MICHTQQKFDISTHSLHERYCDFPTANSTYVNNSREKCEQNLYIYPVRILLTTHYRVWYPAKA